MVLQDTHHVHVHVNHHPTPSTSTSTSASSSSSLHHFLISDHITTQTHFGNPYSYSDHPSSLPTPDFSMLQSLSLRDHHRMSSMLSPAHAHAHADADDQPDAEMGHTDNTARRQFMDLLAPNTLSLSLGSQFIQPPQYSMQNYSNNNLAASSDYSFVGTSSFPAFAVSSSVYLKPAQSVLGEMIDLGCHNVEFTEIRRLFMSGRGVCNELRAELLTNVPNSSSSDKHEIQFKLSKLISLLDQVESRYDEYTQRMEDLILSFEVVAGDGAAKFYTALALQAMCRHFCSLKDAIITQIKLARKKLSPDLSPKVGAGLSQLSLFGQEGRSSDSRLTLQQIGLIQGTHRQAWRPIRGLPETSVTILRTWLFEHFLNPYPNDSEKLTLASQTGLSKNQVSNWFINARVRLWKPMIEEMYKEEFGESSADSSGDQPKE